MGKSGIKILSPLLAVVLTVTAQGAAAGWYFKHSRNGVQAETPPELAYVEENDGFWIDRNHASMEDEDKVLYLTFDAGYENGNVARTLDILKEENVPGAFFVLRGIVEKDTALVKRMAEEGHLVCNHTASHRDMTQTADQTDFAAELAEMEQIYRDTTGYEMAKYYRPPEGKVDRRSMEFAKACGYKTIFWSFAYADWDNGRQMDPAAAKEKVLGETHNGEVILLHPTSETNAAILQDLIRAWKDMGFRFGTLDELTGGEG